MLAVIFLMMAATLILVQARMRQHVRQDLVSSLRAESTTFAIVETIRHQQTEQSVKVLAEQPSLKALMSTNDPATVDEESTSLLKASYGDLLVIESSAGETLGFSSKSDDVSLSIVRRLMRASSGKQDWWFAGGHLFDVSSTDIWMGSAENGRKLGRIAVGREISQEAMVKAAGGKIAFAFERDGALLISSLNANTWPEFERSVGGVESQRETVKEIDFESERYLETFVELPGDHPVRLYCFQSFDEATSFLRSLNQVLLILGAVVLISGAFAIFGVSRQITRPLENLAFATQQLEKGDFDFPIPPVGADEVAGLTHSFDHMRKSLRQSREGLVRSARLEAVGRLSGGVAHDFNNLVMIIKGYSELLLDTASPTSRQYIEEIRNAGDRATALTRQLLAFSRKQVLEPQILDLNHTVRSMAKMLRVLIGEDIELIANLSDEIGRVKADPAQLEQVIMNLAVNARDAMPSGGKLIIETGSVELDETYAASHLEVVAGSYVLIAVTDSGCGMDKETVKHIFEPFFTTKEPGKGTGLGLATVYGILKQSRGHVSVYSEPNIGTTFKVYLPSIDKSVPLTPPLQASMPPRGEGTILLAEDEPPLRILAAESLKKLGYTVLQASNGLEALAVADQHSGPIDLLLTDVVMPRMGGPELADKLRIKHSHVSVILMSGYTEAAAIENNALGPDVVLLNKPFATEVLARKIAETLLSRAFKKRTVAAGV
jgi:signal transduction histidine kinase/ActR/RegA family two-component response regulator